MLIFNLPLKLAQIIYMKLEGYVIKLKWKFSDIDINFTEKIKVTTKHVLFKILFFTKMVILTTQKKEKNKPEKTKKKLINNSNLRTLIQDQHW